MHFAAAAAAAVEGITKGFSAGTSKDCPELLNAHAESARCVMQIGKSIRSPQSSGRSWKKREDHNNNCNNTDNEHAWR